MKESLLEMTSSVIKFGHSFFKIRTTLSLENVSPIDFLMLGLLFKAASGVGL